MVLLYQNRLQLKATYATIQKAYYKSCLSSNVFIQKKKEL